MFGYHAFEGGQGFEHAGRLVGANVPGEMLIYLFMWIPIFIFCYGFYKKVIRWRLAKGEIHRKDKLGKRIGSFFYNTFLHVRVIKKPLAGWMHLLLFWGFIVLACAAGVDAAHYWIGFPHIEGASYVGFSALVDIFGGLALIGIIVLACIRYFQKPDRLNDTNSQDGWILLLIVVILFTGFVIEGARIFAQLERTALPAGLDYERLASPIGWYFQYIFGSASLATVEVWHRVLWWLHMVLAFLLIALIPFTKLWHIVGAMMAYIFRDLEPSQCRMVENIEEAESFGVEAIEEFTWKDLFDLDACTRCGRCQEVCPAYNTGKPLNPKITLIQHMKEHLDRKQPYLFANQGLSEAAEEAAMTGETAAVNPMEESLIYDVVTPEVIWDCTNCRHCMEVCPMYIEHIPKIIEMRRNLVMWQADMSSEAQGAFTNMERNYNPWGVGWANRASWLDDRGVRDMVNLLPEDGGEFEYLLYAGCAVSFDDRYKRVGEALVRLLHQAGVSFGYLGTEEYCCGDSARRLGNEYLYQTLVGSNLESFNNYGVKKIITVCPHGYNTLKNEYPQMGGNYEVVHYTEFLANLIAEGKLKTKQALGNKVSYHDSCFLGRHNDVYDPPRAVIKAAGSNLVEIEKCRNNGFCCGAGGGRMWLEEEAYEGYKRINDTRTDQLLSINPDAIITNCPFCLTMISDGVKGAGVEETTKVYDLAELLWQAVKED